MNPLEYAKAIVGATVAGLGSLYLALDNDVVSTQEWVGVASITIATFGGVWGIPNAPKSTLVSKQVTTVESKTVEADGPEHRATK